VPNLVYYEVVFQKSAYKEYEALPKDIKSKIDEVLLIIRINPYSEILKLKKIKGRENHYRIRVGDYRVIYTPVNQTLVIRIIRVGHRKDVYKFF